MFRYLSDMGAMVGAKACVEIAAHPQQQTENHESSDHDAKAGPECKPVPVSIFVCLLYDTNCQTPPYALPNILRYSIIVIISFKKGVFSSSLK